jgi:hypothetical protein
LQGFIVLIIIAGIIMAVASRNGRHRRTAPRYGGGTVRHRRMNGRPVQGKPDFAAEQVPGGLGIRGEYGLRGTEDRILRAFHTHFGENLKRRVLAKHPNMNAAEYEWLAFELKRFFVMNGVLKQVPMFSERVDDIWHEMLMFTMEYERFCHDIIGAKIHHAPHSDPKPMPEERAWFDWVYGELFEEARFSAHIWQGFCRFPLGQDRIESLESGSTAALEEELFNRPSALRYADIREAAARLIATAKKQIGQSRDPENGRDFGAASDSGTLSYMAGAMMFYSVLDPAGFNHNMQPILPNDDPNRNGSSGCSAGGGGSYGDNSGSGDGGSSCSGDTSGGGDSGGSSCSSSSCGGGSS